MNKLLLLPANGSCTVQQGFLSAAFPFKFKTDRGRTVWSSADCNKYVVCTVSGDWGHKIAKSVRCKVNLYFIFFTSKRIYHITNNCDIWSCKRIVTQTKWPISWSLLASTNRVTCHLLVGSTWVQISLSSWSDSVVYVRWHINSIPHHTTYLNILVLSSEVNFTLKPITHKQTHTHTPSHANRQVDRFSNASCTMCPDNLISHESSSTSKTAYQKKW